ncbi:permease prefix domain 1-containing protein [Nonomuraea angiospora]|uniref:permease prefix domain 1-containing protein n=1 Tax=Nonomuraea angiospora TaxID=46172 RepID=UPI0029A2FB02|nr:permease prefix domain 1-containing protein [Nonomuraea angiospora]MDX3107220.1 permease prefix domain 1-containing protein [Nonomuraea angiospora]
MRIDDYVAELDRALAGPQGAKRDLVVEARDSLTDTADALEAEGLERAEAERVAVAEFGEVAQVAPGYQSELTAVAGRRLGFLLFISVPITALMWSVIWRIYPGDDTAWRLAPAWYRPVSRLLDVLQLCVGLYGGLALFALSRGARWIRRPRLVTRSLGVVVWGMLPVTVLLGMLLTLGSNGASHLDVLPSMLANAVTSACWGLQIYGATRCLRISRPPLARR